MRRDGLGRCELILQRKLAQTLLVYKVSRLFRVAYRGYQFFNEQVVEEGLRGIGISQGIDTRDEQTWKMLLYLQGMMDEMLLSAIADHIRSGLKSLFQQGYVTGALPVGYRPVEVPGAPPTNRGRPRTMPGVDPAAAELIRQHYRRIRDGRTIKSGWRKWVAEGGPHDRRSKLGYKSYPAYRRMFSNPRYLGVWAFGRKRNAWSSKRDYTRQVLQPDTEVTLHRCEELRIVDDELFYEVQQRLEELKTGPRGPKRRKDVKLWDLTTDCFFCAACSTPEKPVRFYQGGANGLGMHCKRGDLCPRKSIVRREEAAKAICRKLGELIRQDHDLVRQVARQAQQLDAEGDADLQAQITAIEKAVRGLSIQIDDLVELAGQGTEADRRQLKAKIRTAQARRAVRQVELTRLAKKATGTGNVLTPEAAERIASDMAALLERAAEGALGEEAVFKAAAVFRQLVGGRIWVQVEPRPGRKRTNVRGTFRPQLLCAVAQTACASHVPNNPYVDGREATEVEVWLRKPPLRDRLALRVHELIDTQNLSYRQATAALQQEGHNINSGVVWQIYQRYYEMIGQPRQSR